MKTFKFAIIIFALIIFCVTINSRAAVTPLPTFTVHVYAYGSSCSTDQNGALVKLYWGGVLQFTDRTSNGIVQTSCADKTVVDGTITYNGHTGTFCGAVQTGTGLTVYVCINDNICCVPNYNRFCYNINSIVI